MKKLLALLLAMVMVMSLAACGGSSDKEEDEELDVTGLYTCIGVEVDGEYIEMDLIDPDNEYSLELKKKGKGVLTIENDEFDFTWELDGEDLHVVTDDESIDSTGTLVDGVIEIEFEETLWIYELEGNDKKGSSKDDDEEEEADEDDEDDKKPAKSDNDNMIVIGDFEAEYLGCEIMEDDDGEDTLVVAFEFYNGSDDEECFALAYFYEFMQDGEELDTTYIYYDPDSYDTLEDTAWEDVESGEYHYVFLTYILNDLDEQVEVEFSDMYDEEFDYLTIDLDDAEEGLVEYYYG